MRRGRGASCAKRRPRALPRRRRACGRGPGSPQGRAADRAPPHTRGQTAALCRSNPRRTCASAAGEQLCACVERARPSVGAGTSMPPRHAAAPLSTERWRTGISRCRRGAFNQSALQTLACPFTRQHSKASGLPRRAGGAGGAPPRLHLQAPLADRVSVRGSQASQPEAGLPRVAIPRPAPPLGRRPPTAPRLPPRMPQAPTTHTHTTRHRCAGSCHTACQHARVGRVQQEGGRR